MTPLASTKANRAAREDRAIQKEVDALEAGKTSRIEPKPTQAGAREYPTEFLPQHHAKPGEEKNIAPAPMYDAPGYKGSEKLLDKVAVIS
jgi:hypothetical protein